MPPIITQDTSVPGDCEKKRHRPFRIMQCQNQGGGILSVPCCRIILFLWTFYYNLSMLANKTLLRLWQNIMKNRHDNFTVHPCFFCAPTCGIARFFPAEGFSFLKTCSMMVFRFFGGVQRLFVCFCWSCQEKLREVVDFLLDYSQDAAWKKPFPFRSTWFHGGRLS